MPLPKMEVFVERMVQEVVFDYYFMLELMQELLDFLENLLQHSYLPESVDSVQEMNLQL